MCGVYQRIRYLLQLSSGLKIQFRPDLFPPRPCCSPCLSAMSLPLLFYLLKPLSTCLSWAFVICPPCHSSFSPSLVCIIGGRPRRLCFTGPQISWLLAYLANGRPWRETGEEAKLFLPNIYTPGCISTFPLWFQCLWVSMVPVPW